MLFVWIVLSEEECYHCMASLVAPKEKVFITQTKLLYEVTWKTVMQIAKKHAVCFRISHLVYRQLMLWSFVYGILEICSKLSFNHMQRSETGIPLHGLVLVDTWRTTFPTPCSRDGLLFSRRNQSILSCIFSNSNFVSQACVSQQFRLGCRCD